MEQGYMYNNWHNGYARNRLGADDDEDEDGEEPNDDGLLLSYKYEKCRRYAPYVQEERAEDRRRSTLGVFVKFSLLCTSIILFCVLMYIPMYNRVKDRIPENNIAGWTVHTNRDTKIYVQPYNVTTLHEPAHICPKEGEDKLFLLIVVCSATSNFEHRKAIRETWGNYKHYTELTKVYNAAKEQYKNYNFSYSLLPDTAMPANVTDEVNRTKREAGFKDLLPQLAEALKLNLVSDQPELVTEEKRFDDDTNENNGVADFDMNKELETNELGEYDYEFESNVMKIPPKGQEEHPDMSKILEVLKQASLKATDEQTESPSGNLDFKLVFLLGLNQDNDTTVQARIEEEIQTYGDIIQENFVDSYNNLTLKSIMMLKWTIKHCSDSLHYLLKTDDDTYFNLPNLMHTLRNRSEQFELTKKPGQKEYKLFGLLISGAKPLHDATNKWFSPRYMYGGRVYPRYLSGTGYVATMAAAQSLYRAALDTPFFHLEDVYITGMCAARARPPLRPADAFGYSGRAAAAAAPCDAHAHALVHRATPRRMRTLLRALLDLPTMLRCERNRLEQVRRDRLKPKKTTKQSKFSRKIPT